MLASDASILHKSLKRYVFSFIHENNGMVIPLTKCSCLLYPHYIILLQIFCYSPSLEVDYIKDRQRAWDLPRNIQKTDFRHSPFFSISLFDDFTNRAYETAPVDGEIEMPEHCVYLLWQSPLYCNNPVMFQRGLNGL